MKTLGKTQAMRQLDDAGPGGLDINVAGEFLVMAATLMEIKSAMLLPRQEEQSKVNRPVL